MAQEVRLWQTTEGDGLKEVKLTKLNLEERIENWLENDVAIIADDLLVIGRQVETDFGGIIDILCMDSSGDIVVVELKRDKTPRDITAQVLDYASWVEDLTYERIAEIGNKYFGDKSTIQEAFRNKFGDDYPEVVNESHKMLVVASTVDSSSERIIKYLSDKHGVAINAITFNYFQSADGNEYLSRVFLIDPGEVEYNTAKTSKRSAVLTFEQFLEIAENKGVGDIYKKALAGLQSKFYATTRHATGLALKGRMGEQKSTHSIIVIYPPNSDAGKGLYMSIYVDRLAELFKLDKKELIRSLPTPQNTNVTEWCGEVGEFYFKSEADIERLLSVLP